MATTTAYDPIIADLRERISVGDLGPGDWLPSEADLMDTYGVTRYSAREALKRLAAEGIVVVINGKGSRVQQTRPRARHHDPRGLTTTHTDTDGGADGGVPVVTDAEFGQWAPVEDPATYRTTAGVDLALFLGIPEHAPLFGVDRLLTQTAPTGTRRMQHRTIVPMTTATRVPALADDPFGTPDQLYNALTDAGVIPTITEHVRAAVPTPDDTTILELTPGVAVLITRRVLRDPTGQALAMEETRRSAEDTQLTYTITPAAPAAPAWSE